MSILIVDDIHDNLILLEAMLKNAKVGPVVMARSAKEAFQKLGMGDPACKSTEVDLILMDIMMPEMDGIDACREIKMKDYLKDIPILMVTAKTDLGSLDDAFKAGATDYILKPIRKVELLARTLSALRLKRAVDDRKAREAELIQRNQELQKANDEIKLLRGFIPVCAYCKKIRDLKGVWQQMEAYLHKHTSLQFSHGICESCAKIQFPQMPRKAA